jgi:drug/metabolite transporter (DMT)-like permease
MLCRIDRQVDFDGNGRARVTIGPILAAPVGVPARVSEAIGVKHRKTESHTLRGIAMMSFAVLCFAVLDSLSKYLSHSYAVPFLIWARYAVHLALMTVIFVPRRGAAVVQTSQPGPQLLRSIFLVATSLLFVSGLRHLPIAEATSIMFLTPLLMTALSAPLLREKVDRLDWAGVAFGFVGVLIIVRPSGALLNAAILLPLAAVVCNCLYQLMTRKFGASDSSTTTNFITGLVGTVMMSFAIPFFWKTPTLIHGLLMFAMGAAATTGHALLIRAYKHAAPAVVGPFSYGQLVWASLLGYLVFGEFPDPLTMLGMAVIVGSGAFVTFHNLMRRKVPA